MDTQKEVEVLQMHAAGLKAPAIATELELPIGTVRALLRKHAAPAPIKLLDEEEVIAKYRQGVPVGEILWAHTITYATLYRVLADNKVPTRAATNAPGRKQQLEAAIKLYEAGAPLWSILQETGISQPVLHNELHRRDIPLRRPRML